MGNDGQVYVYALAAPGLPSRLTVIWRPIHVRHVSGVDAVVESMRVTPDPTIEGLQTQFAVVAALADRVPALLPARFGSVMAESALRSVIASHHRVIHAALQHVTRCSQMTIRVFGAPDAVPSSRLPESGTAFLEERRARAHRMPAEVEVIRRHLRAYAKDERVDPGDRSLRVTVSHLVARAAVDEYRQRAGDLHSMLTPHQVTISGPLPVFAFAPELF